MSSIILVLISDVIVAYESDTIRVCVAQWLEHLTSNQKVMGSIPIRDSKSFSEKIA